MVPVIRIDDEVMDELKKRAVILGLVFEPPNTTLRQILGIVTRNAVETNNLNTNEQSDPNMVEIELTYSSRKYVLIPLPKNKNNLFPDFKTPFELKTDIGVLTAHVTSEHNGSHVGSQIRAGLGPWFEKHPTLKEGDKVRISIIEPGKKYELSLVDKATASNKEKMRPDEKQKAKVDKIVRDVIERAQRENKD
jgi:hypothetical protein